jgi:hypothetical protein
LILNPAPSYPALIFLIDNIKKSVHNFPVFTSNEQEAKVHKKAQATDPDREMLEKAIGGLKESTGLNARIDLPAESEGNETGATIGLSTEDHRWAFSAVIKKSLTNDILGYVIAELREARSQPGVLVTRYVTPNQAEKLRLANAQFIDTVGNAFLNQPPLFVLVTGNRRPESTGKARPARFFSSTGIRVLFALLCKPVLAAASYRDIAAAADVSLGAVSQVMEDLKSAGYLINQEGREGKERRLMRHEELIRRWGEAYSERLRPKLLISRFSAEKADWWKEVQLEEMNACWSGEVAAAKLTKYLRPQIKTIYAPNRLAALQLKFRFRQDKNGDIELLKKFWTFDRNAAAPDTAPALLVYADLMASGDERNIETAGMIYDRYIIRSFGET